MASINATDGLLQISDNSGTLELQGAGVTGVAVNPNGMYVKSVTTTQRLALTPTTGMVVYDTTVPGLFGYNNSEWKQFDTATSGAFNTRGIFGYGFNGTSIRYSVTNLVSTTGVVATDTTGVGTARNSLAASTYGGDKGVFAFGQVGSTIYSIINLVSNTGVVSTDSSTTATVRLKLAGAGYGGDKAIFGYGSTTDSNSTRVSISNLFSNAGVMASDTTGVGTARYELAATSYGGDKALFGYGYTTTQVSMTNLVSNTGVVATDTTGVGTARRRLAACGYGNDKGIFGYGFAASASSLTNLVSNTGVVATDTTGVGTARQYLAACTYGSDKGIFGYGGSNLSITNLVSNTGVVGTDVTGVGQGRQELAATSFA
jgi:hypothetical protein